MSSRLEAEPLWQTWAKVVIIIPTVHLHNVLDPSKRSTFIWRHSPISAFFLIDMINTLYIVNSRIKDSLAEVCRKCVIFN